MKKSDIVTPIQFAKEIGTVPQYVYGLIREGKLESHECICGHKYILRTDSSVVALVQKRSEMVKK
jgi:hypothetical protein